MFLWEEGKRAEVRGLEAWGYIYELIKSLILAQDERWRRA